MDSSEVEFAALARDDEQLSDGAVILRLLVPIVALAVAAAVLFGAWLPRAGSGSSAQQLVPAPAVLPTVAVESPVPTGSPFVLRQATYIYTGSTPVPGSQEAAAAATAPCMMLGTGLDAKGDRVGGQALAMIAAQHPECP